ncbi:Intradiol ring-cleavage dioxygenase [Xylaria bambusicola]|uniref:Intradiol ring-cleavage dioxygenase n=1 Tax=Xylaria bambusicola TaxID=326684 RepID=UPI00200805A4|nr:Intradiol ring-cleavage dioxygenase [Xylaria bambusicola]KAI0513006.1 Intradiol ring-cleavage dioxygenase [Xylaria bambusicola]
MFKRLFELGVAVVLSLSVLVTAHPGENLSARQIRDEVDNAHVVNIINSRALEACQNDPEVKARKARAIARRAATFARLREERGLTEAAWLHRRSAAQFRQWAALSHNKTGSIDLNKESSNSDIFGSNTSCILTPDNANGPYFVNQEHIRSDVTENVPGVPMHLELQFIDVNTCKPATQLLIDTWSCNATGQYSGVSARGEGGLGTTYLRGVQPTDKDGVVSFDTIFPGHYQGRATHQHLIAHVGATTLPNGTYTGGRIAHLSQLFFDQTLRDAIEATAPYNTNRIPKTANLVDQFTGYAATSKYDPLPNYILLGNGLSNGLFVWAELGLNTSSNWDYYAPHASTWKEGGGYNNPNFNFLAVAFPPPTHG